MATRIDHEQASTAPAAIARPGLHARHQRYRGRWFAAAASVALLLSGCGTNPVTGKREVQFISESAELGVGAQQYAPMRQAEGGDYTIDPALTTYVRSVGTKLAAVADRDLPYDFVVLNNSVPNAWALPGGKIAINRGLVLALDSEAELAAVLGHEIVHAAARHGAKAQERGVLLQTGAQLGAIAAGVGLGQEYAGLAAAGLGLGAQLVSHRYGREAELESDRYGMLYMQRAGYDLRGAVSLQETFLKLSGDRRQTGWLEGLFASHPPSQERVDRNRATLAELGSGGDDGRARFQAATAELRRTAPAYKKYDEALAALGKGETSKAQSLVNDALRLQPREARFHELLGDMELRNKGYRSALRFYDRAIELDPGYFKPYVQSAIARYQSGDRAAARPLFEKSMQLLPTAPAAFYLGRYAEESGNIEQALKYYQAAAGSKSGYGKQAGAAAARLDLPRNPGQYLAAEPRLAQNGEVILLVQNRAQVAIAGLALSVALVDGAGNVVQGPRSLGSGDRALGPGETLQLSTGLGPLSDASQLSAVRVRVDGARVVDAP